MRKHGRTIVFALLLLLVPVLANAWTLTVRVNGSSSAGEVTIEDATADTTVVGYKPLKVIKAGTEYVQLSGTNAAKVSIKTNGYNAADVYVDYVAQDLQVQSTDGSYNFNVEYAPEGGNPGNHNLTVNLGTASSAKGNVSVVKEPGGTVLLQYNGTSSMTGFTNLTFGTQIGVKASPRADYKVTSITVSKLAAGATQAVETTENVAGEPGQAVTVGVTVDQAKVEVSAAYELVKSARAMFSAPLKAVAGKPVTLSAAGTTANTAVTYEFVVDGSSKQNDGRMSYTFEPADGGLLEVALNVKSGLATLATKTATINVVPEGLVYNNLCLGCHTGSTPATIAEIDASAHKGQTCTGCHTDAPHNDAVVPVSQANKEVSCASCHGELSESKLQATPFADEVAARFVTSRHANQGARSAACSACHSHEGGVALLSMGKKTSDAALKASYNETIPAYLANVSKKTCFTCHDSKSHNMDLLGDGDVTAAMLGASGTTAETKVVYSAEFNLCTACHMVDLAPTFDEVTGLVTYTLSDKYTAANLVDAATGTYNFGPVFLAELGSTVDLPNNKVFYHDGASGTGRTMVDTHFGGTILDHLVDFAGGDEDIVIKGYNINAGGANACTVCHDPHTGGKMLSANGSTNADYLTWTDYGDNNRNNVLAYAEGMGETHNNYLGVVTYRANGCTPCHTGDSFASLALGAAANEIDDKWKVIGCRSCHDLAQANASAGSNNAEAFAGVREFPEGHVFTFQSQQTVATADLGVSQICFECHKGRDGLKADAATTTHVYLVNYIHYSPSFATLFGVDSGMHPTYEGEEYVGKFQHRGGDPTKASPYNCTDCHEVHSGKVKWPEVAGGIGTCGGCHGAVDADGNSDINDNRSAAYLKARTKAFADRLFETILAKRQVILSTETADSLKTRITARYSSSNAAASDMGTNALAKAGAVWKNFYYDDKAAWAHNSAFARQVMYDAILAIGGDVSGLNTGVDGGSHSQTVPTGRPFVPVQP